MIIILHIITSENPSVIQSIRITKLYIFQFIVITRLKFSWFWTCHILDKSRVLSRKSSILERDESSTIILEIALTTKPAWWETTAVFPPCLILLYRVTDEGVVTSQQVSLRPETSSKWSAPAMTTKTRSVTRKCYYENSLC